MSEQLRQEMNCAAAASYPLDKSFEAAGVIRKLCIALCVNPGVGLVKVLYLQRLQRIRGQYDLVAAAKVKHQRNSLITNCDL
jgi:hypothetical protein